MILRISITQLLVIAWELRKLDSGKAGRGGAGFGDENHLNSFWDATTYSHLFSPCPLARIFIGVGKLVENPYFATALSTPKLCGHCGLSRIDLGVVSCLEVGETLGYVISIQGVVAPSPGGTGTWQSVIAKSSLNRRRQERPSFESG